MEKVPFSLMLPERVRGYGLTTAQIFYRLPDYPTLLQTYVWQEYDLAPQFPELRRFLHFWHHELEGPLHSVMVAHKQLISPPEVRLAVAQYGLN